MQMHNVLTRLFVELDDELGIDCSANWHVRVPKLRSK